MKSLTKTPQKQMHEVKAGKAIQRIQKWMEENYPMLAAGSKSKLIIECLIEVSEERKFLSAQ